MPAVMRVSRGLALAVAVTSFLTLQAAPQAWADRGNSSGPSKSTEASAGAQGDKLGARVSQVSYTGNTKKAGTKDIGELSSSDGHWTPPACWYEPTYSPKDIESDVKKLRTPSGVPIFGDAIDMVRGVYADMMDARFKDGVYKNYNLDKQGKGMFWAAVKNPQRLDDPEASSCDKPLFWVDNGATPDEPLAVSPAILGAAAADSVSLTPTEISMAPDKTSTVNLPTWIRSSNGGFEEKRATASVAGLSATAVAKPVALHIDPGTSDAVLFPPSGNCPINADGTIGEKFTPGDAERTPPCGVTYQRSGTFALKASVTWKISWSSTNTPSTPLPDSIFTTPPQNVTVQEIQSVNR
ncbi:hypothetical protein ACFYM2_18725 [Streptomyces sp. NPDC006711]|uniref:hypothetical protein n=1 Tax=Streptomyces sp. NPDC006711 TaxID=3364762 RepID=UPI00368F186D